MMTKRDVLKTIAATGAAFTMASSRHVLATNVGLSWQHFPTGEHGFFRAPVLVFGQNKPYSSTLDSLFQMLTP